MKWSCVFCGKQATCAGCQKKRKESMKIIMDTLVPLTVDYIWGELSRPGFASRVLITKRIG